MSLSARLCRATAGPEDRDWRLDHWLTARFTYRTRAQWQQHIRDGEVTVNGQPTKAARLLRPGDVVELHVDHGEEPAVDTAWEVLRETPRVLFVAKPGNLPCHPAGAFFRHTLWALLRERYPDARLANRLDRETSGIVVVCRDTPTARDLHRQFLRHAVTKEYLVLVEGEFPRQSVAARGTMVPDAASAVRKKLRFVPGGSEGVPTLTTFTGLASAGGLSLVHALPATGRQHQLRASLLALGYPVVGDKLYGVDEQLYLRLIARTLSPADHAALRLPRQAMHAWRLTCRVPDEAAPVTVTAPVPPDLHQCLLQHGFGEAYSSALPPPPEPEPPRP
jgi:23S rRNA pseudouridine955/2504/2580 synthase/23S rRNA pseudouridine1911/1915/1917 synthase